jgi:deoxyadenosine/deoxycytidine kinase
MENIQRRERFMEQDISVAYLKKIQDSYFEFFKTQLTFPILVLEVEELDFVNNQDHYQELKRLISRKYMPGTHRIKLHL